MSLMGKPPMGLKQPVQRKDKDRLAAVAAMPCVICHEWWMPQLSPTQVHHCIHGRNSMGQRSPDSMTIPLCEGHHQGDLDTSKAALHREPEKWQRLYGPDTGWLSWVDERISKGEQE